MCKKVMFSGIDLIYLLATPMLSKVRFGMVIAAENIDRTMRAMMTHLEGFLAEAMPTPPAIVGKIPHQMP